MNDPRGLVVDSSAVLAILFREDDAESYEVALADAVRPMISAANYVEVGIRLIRGAIGPIPRRRLTDFVRAVDLVVAPVTAEQAGIAIEAYQDFGKGRRPSGAVELRRLFRLCPRQGDWPSAAFQRP